MARTRVMRPPANPRASWWRSIPEKFGVAAATAAATTLVTVAGPPAANAVYAWAYDLGEVTAEQAEFQQSRWLGNPTCANSQPVWHDTQGGRQIDATICPGTGHILIAMRNSLGQQVQWWPNLEPVEQQLRPPESPRGLAALIESPAYAGSLSAPRAGAAPLSRPVFAQNVLCQTLLADKRSLRRRLVVGPNQCVEVILDTFTGQVVQQRPIPCNPNCAVNV